LQGLEERQEHIFPRVPGKIEFEAAPTPTRPEVSVFDLINAVNTVLKRFEKREGATREIYEDKWTVSEKIEFIVNTIAEKGAVKFSELFASAASRPEVVCTFLALLELIRLKQLVCVQPEHFSEIEISRAPIVAPVTATEGIAGLQPVVQGSAEPAPIPTEDLADEPETTEPDTIDPNRENPPSTT